MRREFGYLIRPGHRGRAGGTGGGAFGGGAFGGGAFGGGAGHGLLLFVVGIGAVALAIGMTLVPIARSGSLASLPAFSPQSCTRPSAQLTASRQAKDSIPANYLAIYRRSGARFGIAWQVLAGIGEVESDHGRANMPGVRTGQNGFGAAGPMQIGIGGAAGDQWGGPAVHQASQHFGGVATDGDGNGIDSVYAAADAIPGAARYLVGHGAPGDLSAAIFAYNHLESYVQDVLSWASKYTKGGFTVSAVNLDNGASCVDSLTANIANHVVSAAISYAQQQLGKPYLWGGTGPEAFDCSGLVMMAYRAAGRSEEHTSELQSR